MLEKIINAQGQKAYQRGNDREDRSLVYRDWLRTVDTNGWYMDVDFIKWRKVGDELKPIAITDLTRCDSESVGHQYLAAILDRFFVRDRQGYFLKQLGKLLKVPVYLVLFQVEMKWLKVFSFQKEIWKDYTPKEWADYLKTL